MQFPWRPSQANSLSKSSETVFCVPRGVVILNTGQYLTSHLTDKDVAIEVIIVTEYALFSTLSIYSTLTVIALRDCNAAFLYQCCFLFIRDGAVAMQIWAVLTKRKVIIESLILRWPLRPVGFSLVMKMSLKIAPIKKRQAWSVLGWVISSSTKLCASKVIMRFAGLLLTCVEAVVYGCQCWKCTKQRLASLKGDRGGFCERILKRNVFSKALAIVFPSVTAYMYGCVIDLKNILPNLLFGWPLLVTVYRFVNVNVLNNFNPQNGSWFYHASIRSNRDLKELPELHSRFWRSRHFISI